MGLKGKWIQFNRLDLYKNGIPNNLFEQLIGSIQIIRITISSIVREPSSLSESRKFSFTDFLKAIIFSFAWISLLYSATSHIDYAHFDDYYFFSYDDRSTLENHPQFLQWIQSGRFIAGIIWIYTSKLIEYVPDLGVVRLLGVAFLSLAMSAFVMFLKMLKVRWSHSFIIPALFFALPGVGTSFSWVLGFPTTIAMFAVGFGYIALYIAQKDLIENKSLQLKQFLLSSLALLTFVFGLFIYPSAPMYFLVIYSAHILFTIKDEKFDVGLYLKLCAIPLILSLLAFIIFYLLQKMFILPFAQLYYPNLTAPVESFFAFSVTTDFYGKVQFFLNKLTPTSAALWDVSGFWNVPKAIWIMIVLSLAASGITSLLARGTKSLKNWSYLSGELLKLLFIAGALFSAVLLSISPVLISQGGHDAYRITIGYSGILVVICVWAFLKITTFFPLAWALRISHIMLGVAVVLGGYSAQRLVVMDAASSAAERWHIKSSIKSSNIDKLKYIHVIRPPEEKNYYGAKGVGFQEYLYTSTNNKHHLVFIVRSILIEIIKEKNTIILNSLQNPKILVGYNAKIIGDGVAPVMPLFRQKSYR